MQVHVLVNLQFSCGVLYKTKKTGRSKMVPQARYFGRQATVSGDAISHYLGIVDPQMYSGTIT